LLHGIDYQYHNIISFFFVNSRKTNCWNWIMLSHLNGFVLGKSKGCFISNLKEVMTNKRWSLLWHWIQTTSMRDRLASCFNIYTWVGALMNSSNSLSEAVK
jgi:hypothetical protein